MLETDIISILQLAYDGQGQLTPHSDMVKSFLLNPMLTPEACSIALCIHCILLNI